LNSVIRWQPGPDGCRRPRHVGPGTYHVGGRRNPSGSCRPSGAWSPRPMHL